MEITLPGLASVRTAGVTAVGVRTSHRRRGLLRAMMSRQLDDVAERGESLAILTASESIIYGRFGYGLASSQFAIAIDSAKDAFLRDVDDPGRVRFIDAETAAKVLPELHEQARRAQPGDVIRSNDYWAFTLLDREHHRDGQTAAFYAIHEDAGGQADGYVRYRFKQGWSDGLPGNEVHINDLVATNPLADAVLWRFVLDIDLASTVKAWKRPVDEPLRWLLADPRQLRVTQQMDDVWVRLIDIPASLSARRYEAEDRLVLEVSDPLRPSGAGRYVVDGGADGATSSGTDADADVALGVGELGALYLGGASARALAHAGRITERTPGAVARLGRMFKTEHAPFCRTGF
jgi:predicted acetyltransferase